MGQSRRASAVEATTNIVVGFIVSYLVWVLIVVPLYHLPVSHTDNFIITCIFTVASWIRSYTLRRVFNRRTLREMGRAGT